MLRHSKKRNSIEAQIPSAAAVRTTNIAEETPPPVTQELQTTLNNKLLTATQDGNFAQVKTLLEQGADVDARNQYAATPLMLTIVNHPHAENAIKLFLEHKANPNARDKGDSTPLMFAASFGTATTVTTLIQNNAEVNAQNDNDWTPLMLAARFGTATTVTTLIQNNAEVNAQDQNGWTPLMHATYQKKNHELMNALLNAGAQATFEQLCKLPEATHISLSDQLIKHAYENIQRLFSSDLNDDVLTHLLKSINALTSLMNQYINDNSEVFDSYPSGSATKKNLRKHIITSIDQACYRLTQEANPDDILQMKIRMERIANELDVIQKTSKDRGEKTAKRKLLMSIMLLDSDEQLKSLFNTLLTWLHQNPKPCDIEAVIQSQLLNQPDETIANKLPQFFTSLSIKDHKKLKTILFDYIKKHSGEYKLEKSEDQPKLTIDLIKNSYDTYDKTQPAPALFQILRIHKSGAMDKDTGTWKAFVEAMEHGNFNRTAPAKSSLLGWFAKRKPDNQGGKEMREGPLLHKPQ